MRKLAIIAAATALVLSLATASSIARAVQPLDAHGESPKQSNKIAVVPAINIVGRSIRDRSGNEAGRIFSLIIDDRSGRIEYVLIDGSPTFDLGGHIVAVPWSLMALGPDAWIIGVTVTSDELRHAPLIDRSFAYQLVVSNSQTRRYGYWGYPRGADPYGYGDFGPGDPYRDGFPRTGGYYAALTGLLGGKRMAQRSRSDRLAELERQTEDGPEAAETRTYRGSNADGKPLDSIRHQRDQGSGSSGTQAQNGQRLRIDDRNEPADTLTVDQNAVFSELASPMTTSASGLRGASVYSENGSLMGYIDRVVIDTARGVSFDKTPKAFPTQSNVLCAAGSGADVGDVSVRGLSPKGERATSAKRSFCSGR